MYSGGLASQIIPVTVQNCQIRLAGFLRIAELSIIINRITSLKNLALPQVEDKLSSEWAASSEWFKKRPYTCMAQK